MTDYFVAGGNRIPLSILLRERYGLSQDEANRLRDELRSRGVTPQQIRSLDIPSDKLPSDYVGTEQVTPKLSSLMEAQGERVVSVKEGYGTYSTRDLEGRNTGTGGYFNTGTGGVGYASGSVSMIRSGDNVVYDSGAVDYPVGTFGVNRSYDWDVSRGEVPISSGLYNKYLSDTYGEFSPYRRAEAGDFVVASSSRFGVKRGFRDVNPPMRFDTFKAGALEILPSIEGDVEINRMFKQEEYFRNVERGTFLEGLRWLQKKAYTKSDEWDIVSKSGYNDDFIVGNVGKFVTRAGGSYVGWYADIPKNALKFMSWSFRDKEARSLFSGRDVLEGGVNTAINVISFGVGAYKGLYSGFTPTPKNFVDKFLAKPFLKSSVASVGSNVLKVGAVGLLGYGFISSSDKVRYAGDVAGSFGALGTLSAGGYSLGKEYNIFNAFIGNPYGVRGVEYLSGEGVSRARLTGDIVRNVDVGNYKLSYVSKDAYVSSFYSVFYPKSRVGVVDFVYPSGSGGRFISVGGKGSVYGTTKYTGVFGKDFYYRVKSSGSSYTGRLFKGDSLIGTTKGFVRGKPLFSLMEEDVSFKGLGSKRVQPEFSFEYRVGRSSGEVISGDSMGMGYRGRYVRSADTKLVTKTIGVKKIKGFEGSMNYGKGMSYDSFVYDLKDNPLSVKRVVSKNNLLWDVGTSGGLGVTNLRSTRYNYVDYLPKVEPKVYGIFKGDEGYGFSLLNPSVSKVNQKVFNVRNSYVVDYGWYSGKLNDVSGFSPIFISEKPNFFDIGKSSFARSFYGYDAGRGLSFKGASGLGGYTKSVFKPSISSVSVVRDVKIPLYFKGVSFGRLDVYNVNVRSSDAFKFGVAGVLGSVSNLGSDSRFDFKERLSVSDKLSFKFYPSSDYNIISNERLIYSPKIVSVPRSSYKPKYDVGLVSVPSLRFDYVPSFKPDVPPPVINVDVPPPPPPPDIIPPFYFQLPLLASGGGRKRFVKGGLFNPKYVASVEAGVLGIRGRKPSKAIIESGLTIRPLVRIGKGKNLLGGV